MSKIVLSKPVAGYNLATINDNFEKIESEFQNKVLYRNNPIGESNVMENDLDMNSRVIYNVASVNGVNISDLGDLGAYVGQAQDAAVAATTAANTVTNLLLFRTDVFTGNGVTTTYVLSEEAGTVNDIDLSVGGSQQVPGIDFEYSNLTKTITFLSGPPPNGEVISARYGKVGSSGAGSSAISYGGLSLANFTIDGATPNQRVVFSNTNPLGWNTAPSRKTLDFEFISNGFFAANPDAHLSVVTRCDTSVIATDVRGAGAIMGDLTWTGFNGDQARFEPTTIIESWSRPQISGQRFLWPETTGPRNILLEDGKRYRWVIETTTQPNTSGVYIRYRLYKYNVDTTPSKLAWDLIVDTGDVLDASNISDMTKTGVAFGYVFYTTLSGWTIDVSNIHVTWGPAGTVSQDNSASVSKYGADVRGDLTFLDTGRRIRFPSVTGPSLADALTIQSSTTNGATTLVSKPNGTHTTSNSLYSNNSNSISGYGAVTYGIAGPSGVIETFGYNEADPTLKVNIGASNTVATFKNTGLNILGATRDIGQAIPSWSHYNAGGTNATTFNSSSGLNFEELSTDGLIRTYMSTTPTNAQVEIVVRPIYCMMSALIAELKAKKVI